MMKTNSLIVCEKTRNSLKASYEYYLYEWTSRELVILTVFLRTQDLHDSVDLRTYKI